MLYLSYSEFMYEFCCNEILVTLFLLPTKMMMDDCILPYSITIHKTHNTCCYMLVVVKNYKNQECSTEAV